MRYFSMFSGIGGFESGIHRAFNVQEKRGGQETTQGVNEKRKRLHALSEQRTSSTTDTDDEHTNGSANKGQPHCVGYSEIDKYAIKVYERRFRNGSEGNKSGRKLQGEEWQHEQGHVYSESRGKEIYNHGRNYGDATKIKPEELPDFDLLVGGFPCQAFSVAGKRKGFDDTRGTLFFDIARILAEKRPRHLVLENVKGLLSHDSGKTLQTIFGVLSDLGYRVEWQVLNSKNFGVPQNRERIYIVGHLRGECGRKVFPITKSSGANIQYDVRGSQRFRVYNKAGLAPTIPTMQGGNTEPKIVAQRGRGNPPVQTIEPRPDGNTNTITSVTKDNLVAEPRIRRLTPLECERLQGFPDTEESAIIEVCKQVSANGATKTSNTNDTDQDNAVQNSVLISCEENAVEIYSQGRLLWSANTATNLNSSALPMPIGDFALAVAGIVRIVAKITQDGRAESAPNDKSLMVQVNGKNSVKIYGLEMTQLAKDVRSDTTTVKSSTKSITSNPLDLESTDLNLQILFSYVMTAISGYIPEAIYTGSTSTIQFKSKIGWTAGESDTQRYKMCGNAVTVNVVEAVMRRLFDE